MCMGVSVSVPRTVIKLIMISAHTSHALRKHQPPSYTCTDDYNYINRKKQKLSERKFCGSLDFIQM